jgi:predicted glycoside hydrolase/deacetylase ChbG (UPF0249 family)
MNARSYLIVNADDFGYSASVNRGIVQAHERGIVTSTSLMVRWPGAPEAGAYLKTHASLVAGLHVDLGEWAYRNGEWVALYHVVDTHDRAAVQAEVRRQLDVFGQLSSQKPSHLDTHQHVHQREPTRSILTQIGEELGIPVRHFSPGIRYCGDFYGQTTEGDAYADAISVESLLQLLRALAPGFTELACHPGLGNDRNTMYDRERADELTVLCDTRIRTAIDELGIHLCSFRDATRVLLDSRSSADRENR